MARGRKDAPDLEIDPANAVRSLDLEIVYRAPADVLVYANNARTHSETQVAQLAAAITEFGFTNPVLIDENRVLIAGHGRLLASNKLGLKRIPTITLSGLTDAQRKALVIADNKLGLNAGWDLGLLRSELFDLQQLGFDMSLTGFDKIEMADIFATKTGRTGPDDAPPLEKVVVSKPGDVWLLGGHRIVCGDSCDRSIVALALGEDKPNLMVTDPPYGVSYDPSWRGDATGQKVRAKGKVLNDDRADWREAWALFPGDVAYVWHAAKYTATVLLSLQAAGFEDRAQIIWAKDRFALSRGHYHWRHEPCWYMVRKGATANWQGGRKQDTVWRIDGVTPAQAKVIGAQLKQDGLEQSVWEIPMTVDDGSTGHGTQKPVECMRRGILNNSKAGEFVYEPFLGSGTTLIAAEMTGRKCLAIELSPAYVDVAVRRWQAFTGKTAMLQGAEVSFTDAALKRAA